MAIAHIITEGLSTGSNGALLLTHGLGSAVVVITDGGYTVVATQPFIGGGTAVDVFHAGQQIGTAYLPGVFDSKTEVY